MNPMQPKMTSEPIISKVYWINHIRRQYGIPVLWLSGYVSLAKSSTDKNTVRKKICVTDNKIICKSVFFPGITSAAPE
jgi:hypothetical protein